MKSTHVSPSPSWKALVPQSPPPLHRSAYPQILYLPTCPPTPNRLVFLTLLNGLCFHGSQPSISDELQSIVGRCIDLPHIQPSSSPSSFSRSLQGPGRLGSSACLLATVQMGSSERLPNRVVTLKLPVENLSEASIQFLEDSVWTCPDSEADVFVVKHT